MTNVIMTGATGMIGSLVLRQCLERDDVERVTSLVRRPSGVGHAKLREIIHSDFTDFSGLANDKGVAENALIKTGFERLHIFRPGYIYPVVPRDEPNLFYRLMRPFYKPVAAIYPNIGVTSEDLAAAMVRVGFEGMDKDTFENREILALRGA